MNESHKKKAEIYGPAILPSPDFAERALPPPPASSLPSPPLLAELARVSRVILLASNSESGSSDFSGGAAESQQAGIFQSPRTLSLSLPLKLFLFYSGHLIPLFNVSATVERVQSINLPTI